MTSEPKWRLCVGMRWVQSCYDTTASVLQQGFAADDGSIEWENVPFAMSGIGFSPSLNGFGDPITASKSLRLTGLVQNHTDRDMSVRFTLT